MYFNTFRLLQLFVAATSNIQQTREISPYKIGIHIDNLINYAWESSSSVILAKQIGKKIVIERRGISGHKATITPALSSILLSRSRANPLFFTFSDDGNNAIWNEGDGNGMPISNLAMAAVNGSNFGIQEIDSGGLIPVSSPIAVWMKDRKAWLKAYPNLWHLFDGHSTVEISVSFPTDALKGDVTSLKLEPFEITQDGSIYSVSRKENYRNLDLVILRKHTDTEYILLRQ